MKLILLLVTVVLLSSCSGNQAGSSVGAASTKETVAVTVATVVQKTIPVEVNAIGTVEAYSTVSVKALVNGELKEVLFTEGHEVKKGDPLFKVDPRPFEADLRRAEANLAKDTAQSKQAEANLAKSTAQAKNAEVQARRYENLYKEGVVAKELFDQIKTNADALEAGIRADRAAIENAEAAIQGDKASVQSAKIQLEHCFIRSPMDGRTGTLIVYQGNMIKANENPPLVIINQIQPIFVSFAVPEQYLSEIKQRMARAKLEVQAIVPEEDHPVLGALSFIDNKVDNTTGTIRLKGTFSNQEKRLWPGQFVNVILTLSSLSNAVVVPSRAIQTGQSGQYVFVVKPDLTVELRSVVIGASIRGEIVVEKGLKPQETVVTDGQLRLVPGALVEVKRSTIDSERKGP